MTARAPCGANNEELIREEPINDGNNEREIIPKVLKLEILIENDLEKGKSEIIEIVGIF